MRTVAARYRLRNIVAPSSEARQVVQLEDVGAGTGALVTPLEFGSPQGQNAFEPGDVLFGKLRPYLAKTWLVTHPVHGSGEFLCLRLVSEGDPRFYAYLTMTRLWLEAAVQSSYGSKMPRTSWEQMAEVRIPDPDTQEQRRIADFLDDRVARIDKIIVARRKQAKLLTVAFDTQREAAIRGGDEDSNPVGGWLGRIRRGWTHRRLGQVADFFAGAGFPPGEQGKPIGDFPFVKVSDLANTDPLRRLESAVNWVDADTAIRLGAKAAPKETVLFPKVGAALLTNSRAVTMTPVVFDNNVMGIRFPGGYTRFWFHVMSCVDMAELANPGPVPSIGREAVAELRVPYPSASAQKKIGDTLDELLLSVVVQRAQVEASITLLEEYKQSLITAAVTGEFDVTTASTKIPEFS